MRGEGLRYGDGYGGEYVPYKVKTKREEKETMEVAHQGRRTRWSQEENHRLAANRRSDQRIESTETKPLTRRTQRDSQISPTMHGLKVTARQSYRWG
jgi:hypothetical protein